MPRTLTAKQVKNLAPQPDREVYVAANLRLQFRAGRASWIVRYRRNGRLTRMGAGPYPAVTFSKAVDAARRRRCCSPRARTPRRCGTPSSDRARSPSRSRPRSSSRTTPPAGRRRSTRTRDDALLAILRSANLTCEDGQPVRDFTTVGRGRADFLTISEAELQGLLRIAYARGQDEVEG